MGITEQLIFPEIDYDKIDRTRGMDITVVTGLRTTTRTLALLSALGFLQGQVGCLFPRCPCNLGAGASAGRG